MDQPFMAVIAVVKVVAAANAIVLLHRLAFDPGFHDSSYSP
jgi:hypothetical protein